MPSWVALALALATAAPSLAAPWSFEPITLVDESDWTEIDVRDDVVRVLYADNVLDEIRIATNAGAGWTTEFVAAGSELFNFGSPIWAFDDAGQPWIVFVDRGTDDVRVARPDGGSWTVEVVGSGDTAMAPDIALDASGNAHVAYGDQFSDGYRYATNESGAWVADVIAPDNTLWGEAEIWIDDAGIVRILLHQGGELWLFTRTATGWDEALVGVEPGQVRSLTVAVAPDGVVHAAYQVDESLVRHATHDGSSWAFATIADVDVGLWLDLAVDEESNAHVVYRTTSFPDTDIYYARSWGGFWSTHRVITESIRRVAVAVDNAGAVHLAWARSGTPTQIRYGYNPQPVVEVEDTVASPMGWLAVRPNPSRGSAVTILSETNLVSVDVFDVAGRLVRRIGSDDRIDERRMRWDGQTTSGVPVAPGVYLVRGRGASSAQTTRLVVSP